MDLGNTATFQVFVSYRDVVQVPKVHEDRTLSTVPKDRPRLQA